jgi:hypothetical protein
MSYNVPQKWKNTIFFKIKLTFCDEMLNTKKLLAGMLR